MRISKVASAALKASRGSMPFKKQYLLLDLNGTVHVGDDPTPGALEALKRLRAESRGSSDPEGAFQFRFCSNSSKEASSSLATRLRKMGFDEEVIPASELTTSLDACAELCKVRQHKPLLMLNPSAQSVFPDSSSFKPDPQRSPKDLSSDEWEQLKSCDAVVVGLAPDLMRHEWLDDAFRLLSGEYGRKAQLIGTHRAMYLRPAADSSGNPSPLSLGPGAFLAALEAASGCDPGQTVIVGKPQQEFFAQCLRQMGWDGQEPAEAWIVGDDAVQDLSIPFAREESSALLSGSTIKRGLVKTGKYRSGDEDKVTPLPGSPKVDGVWETFAEWVDWWLQQHQSGIGHHQ